MPTSSMVHASATGTASSGTVIGAIPQDLKFRGEETTAEIGDNNTIRENVTINRGTQPKDVPSSVATTS